MTLGRALADGWRAWSLTCHVRDPGKVPVLWLQPGPALIITTILRTEPAVGTSLFIYLSVSIIKKVTLNELCGTNLPKSMNNNKEVQSDMGSMHVESGTVKPVDDKIIIMLSHGARHCVLFYSSLKPSGNDTILFYRHRIYAQGGNITRSGSHIW